MAVLKDQVFRIINNIQYSFIILFNKLKIGYQKYKYSI